MVYNSTSKLVYHNVSCKRLEALLSSKPKQTDVYMKSGTDADDLAEIGPAVRAAASSPIAENIVIWHAIKISTPSCYPIQFFELKC